MLEITLQESKDIMMQILKDIALFCDENNLCYYLTYGTLIGAIRHKGFIPWDDDIDIAMPRPDYERFVKLYHQKGRYGISSPLIDKGCFYLYSKVYDKRTVKIEERIDYKRFEPLGIDVDVFPLDGIPDEKYKKQYLFWSEIRYWLGIQFSRSICPFPQHFRTLKGKLIGPIVFGICRMLGQEFFASCYIKIAKLYNYEDSEYIHVAFPSRGSFRTRHAKSIFSKRIKVLFENEEFWVPIGYDEYLSNLYGNYMQLPPIEKRKTHHSYKVYWK